MATLDLKVLQSKRRRREARGPQSDRPGDVPRPHGGGDESGAEVKLRIEALKRATMNSD